MNNGEIILLIIYEIESNVLIRMYIYTIQNLNNTYFFPLAWQWKIVNNNAFKVSCICNGFLVFCT